MGGSGLIGPWPCPGGGSCQSATFDCQPKLAEVRLGILFVGFRQRRGGGNETSQEARKDDAPRVLPTAARTRARNSLPTWCCPSFCDDQRTLIFVTFGPSAQAAIAAPRWAWFDERG